MGQPLANGNIHFLNERAWELLNMVNDEISKESVSFCRLCSEHGHLCGITVTPWEERHRLLAIRDSLKDVENILDILQKLQAFQMNQRHLALAKLEDSKMALMEKVNAYKAKGRKLKVIEELCANFGNDAEEKEYNYSKEKRRNSWCLMGCIRSLLNPWVAIKLIVIPISISSSYNIFYKAGQEFKTLGLAKGGGKQNLLLIAPNNSLNVLHGRG